MTKKLLLPLFLSLITSYNLYTQGEPDYRDLFLEAESYFLFEEYNESLPIYLRINSKFPENNNINYKIGVCYLNNPYEKEKAISYLERAVTDINPDYKENNFKETHAPADALFHLGNAYRINNRIDTAIETYKKFKEQSDPSIYDHKLVDEQINACYNAIDLKTRPVDIDIVDLGDRINTRFSDIDPVVSGDETKMVYIQKQQFYDAVFFSEKVDGVWSYPRNIIPELGVDEDAYPASLSYDGNTLIIYRNDNFIGDLYTSGFSNGTWSNLTRLNDNINTKYWESHACLTRNSDTLIFTSNRKGGYGGLDIYYSIKDASDQWDVPVNMGPVINTIYNEETPFITSDGKTLYFSSYGHYNMGGYDVFYTTLLDDGTWAVPVNAGFPVNTTEDDIFFVPVDNGIFAYYSRFLDQGLGRTDIYKIEIFSGTHPRKFRIRGLVSYPTEALIANPVTVRVINKESQDTVALTNVSPETGGFSFDVTAGEYDILVEGEGIQPATSSLIIPKDFKGKEIELENAIEIALIEKPEEITQPKIVDEIKLADEDISLSYKEKTPGKETVTEKVPGQAPPVPSNDTIIKQFQAGYLNQYIDQLKDLAGIMKVLIDTASGPLQELLIRLNLESSGIENINDLFNYLIAQAKYNNYTESDVIKLFLDLLNVMNRQELIRKVEPSQLPTMPATPEKKSHLCYYMAGAGLLIILLLIIIILVRRKNKKQKQG